MNFAISPRGSQGFLANQILVLVDGRQIYDSVFGGTLWGSWPFQLEDIARIEVIRGPGGVTWGANAVNGVINIITKDPADQKGVTATGSGGSRGSWKSHLGIGHVQGNFRFRISGEYESGDGFHKGGSVLRNLDDDFGVAKMSLHAIWESDNETFTLSAGHASMDGGFTPPPLGSLLRTRNAGSQASFAMFRWAREIAADNNVEISGFVNDFWISPGLHSIDYRYQQIALQMHHTFTLDQHTLTWGIDGRADLADASNADPFMLSKNRVNTGIVGVFLQDAWRFAPRFTVELGARVDYEFYGGLEPSLRAALAYEVADDQLLYGSISRSFSMPPAASRFLNTPLTDGLLFVTADRDLDPRVLLAYELGYRAEFFERLHTSISAYWHEYDDHLALPILLGPPGLFQTHFSNVGNASNYGIEMEFRFAAREDLDIIGNYTYQEFDWRSRTPYTLTDQIEPPQHKFMLGARYRPTEDLNLSAHLYYVDATKAPNPILPMMSTRIDPYLRLDLTLEYEFWDDDAAIVVGVQNLLDGSHREGTTLFMTDAEVPRMVFAEMRISAN